MIIMLYICIYVYILYFLLYTLYILLYIISLCFAQYLALTGHYSKTRGSWHFQGPDMNIQRLLSEYTEELLHIKWGKYLWKMSRNFFCHFVIFCICPVPNLSAVKEKILQRKI